MIFHHGRTVHLAKPNRSGSTRRAYAAIFFKDGCTRGGERPHPSVDRDGIAMGAPIVGAATPVVWPLADGRFPEPGPWPELDSEGFRRSRQMGVIPGGG